MESTFFKRAVNLAVPVCALAFVTGAFSSANAACTATGFSRDSINLTAAQINPTGTVSGDVDATGCNIGIDYGPGAHGRVNGANVHDANYFGIVNNGGDVDIRNSNISDIGEKPLNGSQHGVGIYFAFGAASKGSIQNNTVSRYQKGGIVVNGSASNVNVQQNTVLGVGPVDYIAQNGIQIGYGAKAQVQNNFVSGNAYTGGNFASSGGILVVGGDCNGGPLVTNIQTQNNTAVGNDVGVWLTNLDASCNPPASSTKNTAENNQVTNNEVTNTTGFDGTTGYQAGIADNGNGDTIQNNDTCGPGYTPPGTPTAHLFAIDTTFTANAKVKNNTVCGDSGHGNSGHAATAALSRARGHGHRAPAPAK
jgi:parallel beta-helix repeat protein